MRRKFGITALLLSSITFAGPVSTPGTLNDTPIISGGVSGGTTCRSYQTNGTAITLSGGETLVFYGGGSTVSFTLPQNYYPTTRVGGGFLSAKTTYSGTAYVQVRSPVYDACYKPICRSYPYCCDTTGEGVCSYYCSYQICWPLLHCWNGSGIGLFARNTTNKDDFIAGAGGSFGVWFHQWSSNNYAYYTPAAGGGWAGEHSYFFDVQYGLTKVSAVSIYPPGTTYWGYWFGTPANIPQGFHSSSFAGGAASSVSAFYNSYTKDYTSVGTSFTITGGGSPGVDSPILYVCQ
jgi:hypothetical protein